MASLGQVITQLRNSFAGQSRLSKFLAFAVIGAVLGTLLYVSFRDSTGAYDTLYPAMELDDASAVVAYLKTAQVDYKLENGGSTILVPRLMIPELRMQLAQLNLPMGGGVGFEWFDKPPIGMTDRVQAINYTRALQGELGRSITTISSVESARVILAIPERSAFLRSDENKPSASVVVQLARGSRLSERNVEGILNLISTAVEGLEPENIALVDARSGESLNREKSTNELNTDSNLAFKSRYENDLERDIESMIERSVGRGRVVARVNADFSFKQMTTTSRTYDDDAKAVQSENIRLENGGASSPSPSGVVGSASSIPGSPDSAAAVSTNAVGPKGSSTEERKYAVSQTDMTTVDGGAALEHLTVAVMVDQKPDPAAPADSSTPAATVPRSPQEITSIETLVKKTVGLTEDRADKIEVSVQSVPFAPIEESVEDVALQTLERQEMIRHLTTWGVYLLLGVLVLLFVARPVVQALVATAGQLAQGGGGMRPALAGGPRGALTGGDQEAYRLEGNLGGVAALPRKVEDSAPADLTDLELDKRVNQIVEQDPSRASSLIRRWLEER